MNKLICGGKFESISFKNSPNSKVFWLQSVEGTRSKLLNWSKTYSSKHGASEPF